MNLNFFRTLLNAGSIGAILTTIASIFSCAPAATTAQIVCDAAWVSPEISGIVALVLQFGNLFLKMFQGSTVGTGLFAKTVVVVPEDKAGRGSVTEAQVQEP